MAASSSCVRTLGFLASEEVSIFSHDSPARAVLFACAAIYPHELALTTYASAEHESLDKHAPITVKFEIPYFTVSGIQVRYLKIVEKSGYQALPWVRYITQNGDDYRYVACAALCHPFPSLMIRVCAVCEQRWRKGVHRSCPGCEFGAVSGHCGDRLCVRIPTHVSTVVLLTWATNVRRFADQ